MTSPSTDQVRAERGELTQAQAAELVMVSRRTWQDWEAGVAAMPPGLWWLFLLRLKRVTLAKVPKPSFKVR